MEQAFIFIGIGIFALFLISFLYRLIRKQGKFVAFLGMLAGIILIVGGYLASEAASVPPKPVNNPANQGAQVQTMPEEQLISSAQSFVTPFLNLPPPITFQQSMWKTKQIGMNFEVTGRASAKNGAGKTETRDFIVELTSDDDYRVLTPKTVWVDNVKVYPK